MEEMMGDTPKNVQSFFSADQAAGFSEALKALGHPVRLRIIDLLTHGSLSVGELAQKLDQQQAIVSQQLKILRLSGLVSSVRAEGRVFYSIAVPHLRNLLECLRACGGQMNI
jgi:ArsR family transcriptional regulator, zinc-responsive transcriptional repressor